MLKSIILFSLVFILACSQNPRVQLHADLKVQESLIMDSVFRYLIKANEGQSDAKVYCLSIGTYSDPPADLLSRFQDLQMVKRYSDCELVPQQHGVSDPIGFAIDPKSGDPALIFYIESVELKNSTHARVKAGYYRSSLSSALHLFYLSKKDNDWMIEKRKLISIS